MGLTANQTMSAYIPVKENGINPVEYIKPYFSKLSESDLSTLVGSVLLLRDVKFKLLQSLLGISRLEVEEKLGRVLQTDLWEGKFTRNSFKLTRLMKQIQQQDPELSTVDRSILAFLKACYTTSFTELKNTFALNFESVIYYLSNFVSQGLISVEMMNEESFNVIVYYNLPVKDSSNISPFEKQVVGFARLSENITVKSIASELQVPEHRVEASLTALILSNTILSTYEVTGSKFRGFDVIIRIKHFLIPFEKRTISMMSSNERIIIGISTMQKGVQINDLAKILKLERSEILKIVALLNGTKEFEFTLKDENILVPVSVPIFQANVAIDDIDRNSVINYRSLFGYLLAKNEVTVEEISSKMSISSHNVIKGLVDLFLNGLIMGSLIGLKKFKLETVRNTRQEYVTLESWEKIIIGGLLAEEKLSMAKLGVLLNLNRELTQERALSFISRNIGKTIITNAFLTLKGELKIPPLIQLQNLEPVDQQIYSYLITNRIATIKRLRNLFSLSNKELYRRIYYLVGSGILLVKTQKQTFTVTSHHQFTPIDPVEQLDNDLKQLIKQIESSKESSIRIGKLASRMNWEIDDVIFDVSYLVGYGYYKGYIQRKKFIKKSGLYQFKDKPKCFECSQPLDNFRDPCPNCYARPPQCSVCRSKMNSSEDIVMCPHCKNSAHVRHIREWIKIKGFCPICRNNIRDGNLVKVTLSE